MTQVLKTDAVNFLNSVRSVSSFIGGDFRSGERLHYLANLKKVARMLAESKLPETTLFNVGDDRVAVVKEDGKEVELYGIFMDTFNTSPWKCETYCQQHLREFQRKLEAAEGFLL